MKKKILIIGNNNGLPGVKIDLENYKTYFKSKTGGEWYDSEIIERINPKKDDLIKLIDFLKNQSLDYAIVIFSGHGGMKRETVLEINPEGELFAESRFENIAKKQVTILDCCRAYSESLTESLRVLNLSKAFSSNEGTRIRFENRISEAIPQQIKMYSCAEGEKSYDTPKGGVYSKYLLETAYADKSEFIYWGKTHVLASEKTSRDFNDQHPEIIQPKLMTTQQLIFGIN